MGRGWFVEVKVCAGSHEHMHPKSQGWDGSSRTPALGATRQALENTLGNLEAKWVFFSDEGCWWSELHVKRARQEKFPPHITPGGDRNALFEKWRLFAWFLSSVRRDWSPSHSNLSGRNWEIQHGVGFDSHAFICLHHDCLHRHLTQCSLYRPWEIWVCVGCESAGLFLLSVLR